MPTFLKSLIAFSAFVIVSAIGPAWSGVYDPETFTLKNGMQVVVVNNARVPVVTHMVWYKVGSADEPLGKSGLAHYFEHLMFKGTKKHPNGTFSETVARNGGRENAFTSRDYTGYYQTVAKDRLELVMELEADRMTGLTLTKEVIEPERQVILEERRSRVENDPMALLQESTGTVLFRNHPYRIPIIGWAEEIKDLSLNDLERFYKRWYAPNNAILVVTGDITAEELKPLAEKYYGVIPRVDTPERVRPPEPQHLTARRVTLSDERVRQPLWSRQWLSPSAGWGDGSLTEPLEVLADVLGGGATSRLYKSLVVDQKLALGAGAQYDGGNLGPATFTVYAAPVPGVSMETIEAAVVAELDKVRAEGLTADEVARSTKRMIAEAAYARDSLSGGGWALGSALASGLPIEFVENWPERIQAVGVSDTTRAVQSVLDATVHVTGILLPKTTQTAEQGKSQDNAKGGTQ